MAIKYGSLFLGRIGCCTRLNIRGMSSTTFYYCMYCCFDCRALVPCHIEPVMVSFAIIVDVINKQFCFTSIVDIAIWAVVGVQCHNKKWCTDLVMVYDTDGKFLMFPRGEHQITP